MLPIVAGIISSLIQNNLPKVAQAVADKGIDYVSDKLGVQLKPEMTAEEITAVKVAAIQHEEFRITADNANTANARDMTVKIQETGNASWLAKNTSYILDFTIVLSTIVLSCFAYFYGVPEANKELVYLALGSMITLTGTVLNFHRGSSSGSERKTELMKARNAK
jgi:hypothetical protein